MMLSFGRQEALDRTFSLLPKPSEIPISLIDCTGWITARDARAKVNSPSTDVSLKDGYAIRASDVRDATQKHPAELSLCGMVDAGEITEHSVPDALAARILVGSFYCPEFKFYQGRR
jgi:molybdopterin biosynthesis enzyme